MFRIASFLGLVVLVAVLNACASPTGPTSQGRTLRTAQDDTTCRGWVDPNSRC